MRFFSDLKPEHGHCRGWQPVRAMYRIAFTTSRIAVIRGRPRRFFAGNNGPITQPPRSSATRSTDNSLGGTFPPLVFRAFARPCSGFTSSASSSTIGKSASPAPKRLSPRSLRRTRRQSLDRCPVLTGSGGRNRIRTYDLLIKRGLVQLQMGAIKLQVTLVAGPRFEPTSAPARSMILVVCVPPQPFTRGSERKPKPEYEMVGIVPSI